MRRRCTRNTTTMHTGPRGPRTMQHDDANTLPKADEANATQSSWGCRIFWRAVPDLNPTASDRRSCMQLDKRSNHGAACILTALSRSAIGYASYIDLTCTACMPGCLWLHGHTAATKQWQTQHITADRHTGVYEHLRLLLYFSFPYPHVSTMNVPSQGRMAKIHTSQSHRHVSLSTQAHGEGTG